MTTDANAGPENATITFSDEDVAAAMSVITRDLDGEIRELVTLTDEELLALDGVQHEQITALPWVAQNAPTDEERRLVTAAAMRSFLARGLVVSSAVLDPSAYQEGSTEPLTFQAVPELRGTAVLRRTADAVVVMERATTEGTASSSFYILDIDGRRHALWEAFDDQGIHLFHLVPGHLVVDQIVAFADPLGVLGDADEEPVEVPVDTFASSPEAARLAESRAATTILVARREDSDPVVFTLLDMPDHVVLMEDAVADRHEVRRLGAVSRSTIHAILDPLLPGDAGNGETDGTNPER